MSEIHPRITRITEATESTTVVKNMRREGYSTAKEALYHNTHVGLSPFMLKHFHGPEDISEDISKDATRDSRAVVGSKCWTSYACGLIGWDVIVEPFSKLLVAELVIALIT